MRNLTHNFDMMLICSPFLQHQHYGFEFRRPENFSRSSGIEHLLICTDQKFALHTYPPLAWRFAFCCAQLWCIQQGRGAEDRTLTWATRCKQAIASTRQGPGGGDSDICAVSECFKLDIKRSHAHPLWYRLGPLFKTKNSRIPGMFVSHVPESCFTVSLKSVHLDCRRSI